LQGPQSKAIQNFDMAEPAATSHIVPVTHETPAAAPEPAPTAETPAKAEETAPEIPKKYKAAIYDKPGTISTAVVELDTPEPGPGEVLIRLYVCFEYFGLKSV
jgi:hypothetical protein